MCVITSDKIFRFYFLWRSLLHRANYMVMDLYVLLRYVSVTFTLLLTTRQCDLDFDNLKGRIYLFDSRWSSLTCAAILIRFKFTPPVLSTPQERKLGRPIRMYADLPAPICPTLQIRPRRRALGAWCKRRPGTEYTTVSRLSEG